MFARQDTIIKAISVVRKQASSPIPFSRKAGGQIYMNRSEWVESCAKIHSMLCDVLDDVQNNRIESLNIRTRNVANMYKKQEMA